MRLRSAHGVTLTQDGYPLRFEDKPMSAATVNEIADATIKLGPLNRALWELVQRLEGALGVRRVRLPLRLGESQPSQESHPPTDTAQEPGEPQ